MMFTELKSTRAIWHVDVYLELNAVSVGGPYRNFFVGSSAGQSATSATVAQEKPIQVECQIKHHTLEYNTSAIDAARSILPYTSLGGRSP